MVPVTGCIFHTPDQSHSYDLRRPDIDNFITISGHPLQPRCLFNTIRIEDRQEASALRLLHWTRTKTAMDAG